MAPPKSCISSSTTKEELEIDVCICLASKTSAKRKAWKLHVHMPKAECIWMVHLIPYRAPLSLSAAAFFSCKCCCRIDLFGIGCCVGSLLLAWVLGVLLGWERSSVALPRWGPCARPQVFIPCVLCFSRIRRRCRRGKGRPASCLENEKLMTASGIITWDLKACAGTITHVVRCCWSICEERGIHFEVMLASISNRLRLGDIYV